MEQEIQNKKQNKLKQFWRWLWHSDSILSWVVSLALAFIIVKFVFFPLLSFALATPLPLVVVESSSMEHPGSFVGNVIGSENNFQLWWSEKGYWYETRDITEQQADSWPLKTGFDKGDIMVIYGRDKTPEVGDVIVFNANTQHPIIHRIISINSGTGIIETKGDNNAAQLSVEQGIPEYAIVGKAVARIPKLGWLKLVFVEIGKAFSK